MPNMDDTHANDHRRPREYNPLDILGSETSSDTTALEPLTTFAASTTANTHAIDHRPRENNPLDILGTENSPDNTALESLSNFAAETTTNTLLPPSPDRDARVCKPHQKRVRRDVTQYCRLCARKLIGHCVGTAFATAPLPGKRFGETEALVYGTVCDYAHGKWLVHFEDSGAFWVTETRLRRNLQAPRGKALSSREYQVAQNFALKLPMPP